MAPQTSQADLDRESVEGRAAPGSPYSSYYNYYLKKIVAINHGKASPVFRKLDALVHDTQG